jgi:hypothetical protein
VNVHPRELAADAVAGARARSRGFEFEKRGDLNSNAAMGGHRDSLSLLKIRTPSSSAKAFNPDRYSTCIDVAMPNIPSRA